MRHQLLRIENRMTLGNTAQELRSLGLKPKAGAAIPPS
jgi:hypothetical protein